MTRSGVSPAFAGLDRAGSVARLRSRAETWAAAWPAVVVSAAGLAGMAWAGVLLVRRVDGLSAPPYDLAFFQQIVWNIGQHGAWLSSFHEGSFLGLHFSPILVVPALVEGLVWADVRVLSLIHAAAIGALAPAAFLFLRAVLRPSPAAGALAAALAIGIPVWGTTQEVIRSDFHPETMGVVLALLAGWAGLTGRPRAMWALALLALATREDLVYAVGIIGLVVAAHGRTGLRRHGRILVGVALAWGLVVFGLVMPWIRAGAASDTDGYYRWLGGGLAALSAPFTMTDAVVAALTRPAPWFVVAGMVVALVGLPLLRPRWALLALPPLVALLLSANPFQAGVRLQYPLVLLVPLIVAAGLGGRRAIAIVLRSRRRWPRRRSVPVGPLLLVVALPAIAGGWVQGSLPPFDPGDPAFAGRPASIERLKSIAAEIPPDALLVADEGLVAPLAGRTSISRVTGAAPPAFSHVLIDRLAWTPTGRAAAHHDGLVRTLESGTRPVLADDGRFVLWGPQPTAAVL